MIDGIVAVSEVSKGDVQWNTSQKYSNIEYRYQSRRWVSHERWHLRARPTLTCLRDRPHFTPEINILNNSQCIFVENKFLMPHVPVHRENNLFECRVLRSNIAPKKKGVWTGSARKRNVLISPNKIKCRAISDADNGWRFKSNNCAAFAHPTLLLRVRNNVNVTRRAVWLSSARLWTERFLSLHLWLPVSHLYLWIHKSSERAWQSARKSFAELFKFPSSERF